jgi:TM2 domain-containing membrane protein YozV
MKNVNKTAIIPVIMVICLAVSAVTGHKISNDVIDQIADVTAVVISAGISIWGIFKDHSKKGE